MGKGDRRTRKGKTFRKSFGKSRPRTENKGKNQKESETGKKK